MKAPVRPVARARTHTHTHKCTRFTEARDSGWQWHQLNKSAPHSSHGCQSWTLRKNEKNTSWHLWDGPRKILQVSAGVNRELSDTGIARKLAYYGHTVRKQRSKLFGERDNTTNNARCMQAMKITHSLDGQHQDVDRTPAEESIRMTERTEINGESMSMVCGQPLDRGQLKNRTDSMFIQRKEWCFCCCCWHFIQTTSSTSFSSQHCWS